MDDYYWDKAENAVMLMNQEELNVFKLMDRHKIQNGDSLLAVTAHICCVPILTEVFQKLNTLTVTKGHIIVSLLTDVSW